MIKVSAPCKGCTPETGRSVSPNCHDRCEKYLEYKRLNEEQKQEIRKLKHEEELFYSTHKKKKSRKRY